MGGRTRSLRAALKPLRLYALGQNSLIDAELAAYDAALSILDRILGEIRDSAFVQTASEEALSRYEGLVGLPRRQDLDPAGRRELVLYRLAVAPLDFYPEGMLRSVKAAGMDGEIREDPAGERLYITSRRLIDPAMDPDVVRSRIEGLLPAHLEIVFDVGLLTWDMLEEGGPSWDDWDERDFTWNSFDLDGHLIFTTGGVR